ncbi:LysR family transcriptional regulator [Bordetella holmesii]|uniref:LysR substrate-binding domain protein n=2 Tax=Bordetella holmesii TaxID=35814 RepID=A0A158M3Y6_9BORD|nr:LysR family transcriptional regulator [Bordetella holmesii]AHV93065.1 bacterial regulatory helix-turn-helix, lysR family protein [Bordetella holmesii ATCC 51541]AIT25342.1 bacterial regulatory helix-turn-helix, lysR family protein [Bordetella holmesii 44057]EWM45908.1 bacterial regulatory helix-turn-helix, lysR family protein [Bordetella holmesii 70147]EWM48690.1 bacterial regulatory helix-turn-helix, lysR family protein [Bordetella holmesii 41130]EWM50039.1 bacterial regulatory helix-turn-
MTPEQLLSFACVADAGNISRAAQQLHLSQPALSGQLRLLQDWFGEPLYRRSGHGIALTEAGERLAVHARQLRQVYGQARAMRDAWRGLETGSLWLGGSTTPASYLLPALVAQFRAEFPTISLHLSDGNTRQIVERLASLDLAFIEGEVPAGLPADTEVHAWRRDEVVAIVRADHALARRDSVTLAELAALPLVMREPGSGVRRLVEQAFEQAALPVVAGLELAGVEGVKQAVRAGLGAGFVSVMSMRHEDGTLAALRLAPKALTRTLSILVPHAPGCSRAARRFLAACQAAV